MASAGIRARKPDPRLSDLGFAHGLDLGLGSHVSGPLDLARDARPDLGGDLSLTFAAVAVSVAKSAASQPSAVGPSSLQIAIRFTSYLRRSSLSEMSAAPLFPVWAPKSRFSCLSEVFLAIQAVLYI